MVANRTRRSRHCGRGFWPLCNNQRYPPVRRRWLRGETADGVAEPVYSAHGCALARQGNRICVHVAAASGLGFLSRPCPPKPWAKADAGRDELRSRWEGWGAVSALGWSRIAEDIPGW
jgi:hypothetical protein